MRSIQRIRDAVRQDLAAIRRKDSFARNALYTFSDAAVNILSQLVLTPIVARIYGPAAYGIYGLFTTITSNLASLGGLGYGAAFVLPADDRKFLALVRVASSTLLLVVLLCLPFFLVPSWLYTLMPSWKVMGNWCMLVPWMTLVIGATQMMANWVMRTRSFSFFAKVGPVTNVSLRVSNLAVGSFTNGATWGLVVCDVVVRTLSAIWYAIKLSEHGLYRLFRASERAPSLATALEYKEYPLYVFPSQWLIFFSLQLPIFALTQLGDTAAVGRFTLAGSLLLMPLRLFGYSISSVFIRKATDLGRDQPHALAELVRKMYVRMRLIGLVPFMGLMVFGDILFRWLLGPDWAIAGTYCGIMGPLYLFRLLSEPIASIYSAQRQEKALFLFSLALFTLNLTAAILALKHYHNALSLVISFAAVSAACYIYQSSAILARSHVPWLKYTLPTLALAIMVAFALSALRSVLFGQWLPVFH